MLIAHADTDELHHGRKAQLTEDFRLLVEEFDVALVAEALPIDNFYSNRAASVFAFANLSKEAWAFV